MATKTKARIQKRVSRQRYCRDCGKPIVFVKLFGKSYETDKWIACDPTLWRGNAMVTLVTGTGHIHHRASDDVIGRVPHKASCLLG